MGIASLLRNFLRFPSQLIKRGPKINRRLTPEEIAKRDLMEAKQATQAAKGRYEKASTQLDEVLKPYRMQDDLYAMTALSPGSTAMRAKKVGDETMEMIRASVMKMDLPSAKKVEAIKSAATAVRNADSARLARMNPSTLAKNFMRKFGFIPFAVGYGVADNKEAIGDMLKAVKLPTGIDIEMTPAGEIFGDPAVNRGFGMAGGPAEYGVSEGVTEGLQENILPFSEAFSPPGAAVKKALGGALLGPVGDLQSRPSEGAGAGAIGGALLGPAGDLFSLRPLPVPDLQEAVRFWKKEGLSNEEINLRLERLGYFDEPDPEPGLEEGMIPDLFINPTIDKLLGE